MTERRRLLANRGIVLPVALLLSIPATGRGQTKALSLTEVLDLREHGVSTRQILRSAREYCIAFTIDDSARHQLSIAGADSLLIGGLNSVCTTVKLPEKPLPPIIDDQFAETTTSQGFVWSSPRCKARFEADGVRMENTGSVAMCMVRYPFGDLPASVRVDLDVSQLPTTKSGSIVLGFGWRELSTSYYSVNVSADRRLVLCWNSDRQCNALVKVSEVAAIRSEPDASNQISVEVRGRVITLLVNEARVATYSADGPVAGRLMLGVGPETSLLLVRLRATPLRQ
jgi:hypothetical protein